MLDPIGSTNASERIPDLIKELASSNGLARQRARLALEEIGEPAVPYLIQTLDHPESHARWEAAKALRTINAPAAAPALVRALQDRRFDVRWIAAEALIGIGKLALPELMLALVRYPDSVWLRDGAHHILRALEKQEVLPQSVRPVLAAIEDVEPVVQVPWEARNAWKALTGAQTLPHDTD